MSGPLVLSFKVAATLTSQRVVAHNAAENTCGYPSATSVMPLGITIDDVKDTTSAIPVQVNGKAKLLFNDTVAAGALVGFDTSGRGVPFTPALTTTGLTVPTGVIGILDGAAVSATATIAQVVINPSLMR